MAEDSKKLCRLSSAKPRSKQDQLQQVAQGSVQSGFEYLQELIPPQPLWAACADVLPPS